MKRYDVRILFNGDLVYGQSKLYEVHISSGNTITINNESRDELNIPIQVLSSYAKEGDKHILNIGSLVFFRRYQSTGEAFFGFEEKWLGKMEFDASTGEGTCPIDIFRKVCPLSRDNNEVSVLFTKEFFMNAFDYLDNVCKTNERVFGFLITHLSNMSPRRYDLRSITSDDENKVYIFNLLRLCTTNLLEIEKLISSDNSDILRSILREENSTLEKSKKLSNVVNIPKFALNYLRENEIVEAVPDVKKLAADFDGNTVKMIFDLLEAFSPYVKATRLESGYDTRKGKKITFINNCYYLLSEGYKISPLLNYILRQKMYYATNENFDVPYNQAKLLVDYINLCKQNGFKVEKFPQDLEKTHDITNQNANVLKDEGKDELFVQAIKNNYYIDPMEIDDFVFSCPQDIADLVSEGNQLHHCIASYADAIIQNTSNIYFMRIKTAPTESFVTVELNPITHELVEFKENYNKEPIDPEVIKAVKKFSKKIRKLYLPPTAKTSVVDEDEDE